MQVLKDAPGLLRTIKAHAAKKERILSKGGGHQLLHKAEFAPCAAQNSKKRHIMTCQGALLCKRIRLSCRVGMMAVAQGRD